MYRKSATSFVICALALVSLFGALRPAIAQNGSGPTSGFPEDITVEELAAGEVDLPATAPGSLNLERVTLPADASLASRQVATADVLYVERGALTLVDNLGLTSTLTEGKGVHLRAGATYEARNDGTDDVSILRLSLAASGASASPVATPMATPVAGGAEDDVTVTSLAEFALAEIPAPAVTLFLARATWEPGVDSGQYTQHGPIGMLVETGTLTVSSPSGLDGQLSEGNAVLLPANQPLRTRNEGNRDAVALLFGVIPAGDEAVALVPPTPTPSPTPSPTPKPTATTVPSPTPKPTATTAPSPTATPTPEPTPVPSLYRITADEGFESWGGSGDWKTVNGMLINDGTNDTAGSYIAAPFRPATADYAIEAEIQFARAQAYDSAFGIVARASEGNAYWLGASNGSGDAVIWAGSEPQREGRVADANFRPEGQWHTYRAEVRGNEVRLLIDGTVILETVDNRYLSPGRLGLWSYNSQISVRSFTVYSLDEE